MTSSILSIFALASLLLLPSCANKPEEKPKERKEDLTKPRIVGRIASIPAGRKFVLIQSYGTWDVETGSILTTQGPAGRTSNLRATGEKLGQYAAADIQSGTLEIGDGVYTVSVIPKKTELPAPTAEVQTEPETPVTPTITPEPEPDTSILAP